MINVQLSGVAGEVLTAMSQLYGKPENVIIDDIIIDQGYIIAEMSTDLPPKKADAVRTIGRILKDMDKKIIRSALNLPANATDKEADDTRQRMIDEMSNYKERPLGPQLRHAKEDVELLGRLYPAWEKAKAGIDGYGFRIWENQFPGGEKTTAYYVVHQNGINID